MIDLLFVELGAVVAEVLGRSRCMIAPFCYAGKSPSYAAGDRIEVNFERSLAEVLSRLEVDFALPSLAEILRKHGPEPLRIAAQRVLYYRYDQIDDHGSTPIGPIFPGGEYEGIVTIREEEVKANWKLVDAAAALSGHPWEHQVVVSIDEVTGKIRCYHGFHAEIVREDGDVLVLQVAHAGTSMESSFRQTIRYDPFDTEQFYAGDRVAQIVVRGGPAPRRSGAVFIAPEAAVRLAVEVPKLPPAAAATTADPPRFEPACRGVVTEICASVASVVPVACPVDETRTVVAITANPSDLFQQLLKKEIDVEVAWESATGNNEADVLAQWRKQVHDLFAGAEQVDLVGHSTPIHRYLKLGDCVLDPRVAERLALYMPPTVKRVRVIGCSTASNEAGRTAISAFAQRGLSAYGTTNKVYLTHFDKQGVKRGIGGPPLREVRPSAPAAAGSPVPAPPASETSSPSGHAPSPLPVEPASPPPARPAANASSRSVVLTDVPAVAADPSASRILVRPLIWLGQAAWSVVLGLFGALRWLYLYFAATEKVPHQWIWWLLSPWSTAMPGLLTEPLLTYQIRSGAKIWTLEILFDFECAHFYASTDTDARKQRVYKIRSSGRTAKAVLESYLEQDRHGVELTRRHDEAGKRGRRATASSRAARGEVSVPQAEPSAQPGRLSRTGGLPTSR